MDESDGLCLLSRSKKAKKEGRLRRSWTTANKKKKPSPGGGGEVVYVKEKVKTGKRQEEEYIEEN